MGKTDFVKKEYAIGFNTAGATTVDFQMPMTKQFRLTKQKKFVLAVDGRQNFR